MNKEPFVSIIIPVRNFGRTIVETFEYVLNVDYSRELWEIAFVDGGLSDRNVEVLS